MYQTLFDRLPRPVIAISAGDLRILYMNPDARRRFADAGEGCTLSEAIRPETDADLGRLRDAILSAGAVSDFQIPPADGGAPIRVEGNLAGDEEILLFISPAPAESVSEASANSALHTFQTILNNLEVPVYVVEFGTRRILFANRILTSIFGESLEGKLCWKVFQGKRKPCKDGCLCDAAESEAADGGSRSGECYMKKINKWFHCTCSQVEWTDGKPAHLFISLDMTEHKKQEEDLRYHANYDEMTGTFSRAFGMKMLGILMESCQLSKNPMTICYFDVDNLKYINDTFGHSEGDRLIRTLASAVQETIRSRDIFARVGGDEFVLGLPYCSLQNAKRVLDTINKQVASVNDSGALPYKVSFSVGISEVDPARGHTIEEIVRQADANMYRQKSGNDDAH